jgi:hypothetical protein
MSTLLDDVVAQVKTLPDEGQRDAASLLALFLEQRRSAYELTSAQADEVRRRLDEPSDLVTDEDMEAFFARLGE